MASIKSIMCPVDLTTESGEALRYALALARAYKAKLHICYCTGVSTISPFYASGATSEDVSDLLHDSIFANSKLSEFAEVDWEGVIVAGGDAGTEIVREAGERGVDLIVMRSRRRPRAAALLGSTAETVSRTAPCPVLVTHPHEREWEGVEDGDIAIERVLVAHDFSAESELALRHGLSLAQEYQAELHLLHVLAPPERGGVEIEWGKAGIEGAYHEAARRLQSSLQGEVYLWCRVITAVRWGKVYKEVLDYARGQDIDIICMGANGKDNSFGALFGSNVDRVLRQAPCPVLVARPLKPAVSNREAESAGRLQVS